MKIILVTIFFSMVTGNVFAHTCGNVSWYQMSSTTASGEKMSGKKRTAAHRGLPFGTLLKITNMRNGRTTLAKINDRGPFIRGRILDLSKAAASDIDMVHSGTANVCYEVVSNFSH